jgi:hypothetical protein
MDFLGFYGNTNGSHFLPQRKNSDMLREAQATFSALPLKEAEDLREFLQKNSDNIRTYDLTEENVRLLKQLCKFRSFILSVPSEPLSVKHGQTLTGSKRKLKRCPAQGDNRPVRVKHRFNHSTQKSSG